MKVQHYHVEENLVTVPSQIGIGNTDIGQLASSFVKSGGHGYGARFAPVSCRSAFFGRL